MKGYEIRPLKVRQDKTREEDERAKHTARRDGVTFASKITEVRLLILSERSPVKGAEPGEVSFVHHYTLIKSASALHSLVKNDVENNKSYTMCTRCFSLFDNRYAVDVIQKNGLSVFEEHMQRHLENREFGEEVLPEGDERFLSMGKRPFKKAHQYFKADEHDWFYVADFEAYLQKLKAEGADEEAERIKKEVQASAGEKGGADEEWSSSTTTLNEHVPASFMVVRMQRVPGGGCVGSTVKKGESYVGRQWSCVDGGEGTESVVARFHRRRGSIQEDNEQMVNLRRLINKHNKVVSYPSECEKKAHWGVKECRVCLGVEGREVRADGRGFAVLSDKEKDFVDAYWAYKLQFFAKQKAAAAAGETEAAAAGEAEAAGEEGEGHHEDTLRL